MNRSKDDADAVGLEGLRRVCEAVSIPVVSIGGVTAENAGETMREGAVGVAVISAICGGCGGDQRDFRTKRREGGGEGAARRGRKGAVKERNGRRTHFAEVCACADRMDGVFV